LTEIITGAAIALTYGCVAAFSVLGTVRAPIYGAALLLALQPFALYCQIGDTTLTLAKVALIGVLAGLLYRSRVRVPFSRTAGWLVAAQLAVIATTAVSIWQAQFVSAAIRETLKACEYLLLFVAVYSCYRADPREPLMRWVLSAVTALVCITALLQEVAGAPSQLLINGHLIPRIAGALEGPNQLAGFLGIMIPVLLALCIARSDRWCAASLGLATATLLMTFSRAGVVTTAIAVALVFLLSRDGSRRLGTLAVAIGAGAGLAGAGAWAAATGSLELLRLWHLESTSDTGGVGTRSRLWRAALLLWQRHPIWGIGAGNFEYQVRFAGLPRVRTHANSLFLQALVEQGVLGLVSTLFLVWQSILGFARTSLGAPLSLGAMAASLGLALHQIVDLLIFYPKVGGTWWILLALGCAAAREFLRPVENRSPA